MKNDSQKQGSFVSHLTELRTRLINILYAGIIFPSVMWMPMTFEYLLNGSVALWWAIRMILFIVGVSSSLLFILLLFLNFNLLKDEEYFSVRYQYKPLMFWVWISTFFLAFGGVLSFFRK